jgi:hypothetical protein
LDHLNNYHITLNFLYLINQRSANVHHLWVKELNRIFRKEVHIPHLQLSNKTSRVISIIKEVMTLGLRVMAWKTLKWIHFQLTNNTQLGLATKITIYLPKNHGSKKLQLGTVLGPTLGSKTWRLSSQGRSSTTSLKLT